MHGVSIMMEEGSCTLRQASSCQCATKRAILELVTNQSFALTMEDPAATTYTEVSQNDIQLVAYLPETVETLLQRRAEPGRVIRLELLMGSHHRLGSWRGWKARS